jgi:hypothetical protein
VVIRATSTPASFRRKANDSRKALASAMRRPYDISQPLTPSDQT